MDALPVPGSDASDTTAAPAQPAAPAEAAVTRAIALLMEGLLSDREFGAVTGVTPQSLPTMLADPVALAEAQKAALELRNSGALARLEALRHARRGVEVAAEIMGNEEMHAGMRLNAAAYIAKVAGTERAPAGAAQPPQNVRIVINGLPVMDTVSAIEAPTYGNEETD